MTTLRQSEYKLITVGGDLPSSMRIATDRAKRRGLRQVVISIPGGRFLIGETRIPLGEEVPC